MVVRGRRLARLPLLLPGRVRHAPHLWRNVLGVAFYGNGDVTDSRWSTDGSVTLCTSNSPQPRLFRSQQSRTSRSNQRAET
jgi:hypothetical protein